MKIKIVEVINGLTIPTKSGIYKFLGKDGEVLYVGKAKNLEKRLLSYTKIDRLSTRIERMVNEADNIEYIRTSTELEALLLEHNLIKKHLPKYNILLKDDKTFPFIEITKHDFPSVKVSRIFGESMKNKDKKSLFGPFASGYEVYKTMEFLKRNFKIRTCSDSEFSSRKTPCLEYQIKKCSAPCVNKISKENYNEITENIRSFLRGEVKTLQEDLAKKMEKYSEEMEYEKAIQMRDTIKALTSIQAKQNINNLNLLSNDLIVIFSNNTKIAINISFYRNSNNFGSRSYFYDIDDIDAFNENKSYFLSNYLENFMGQFYQKNEIPMEVTLNIEIENKELMNEFLSELAKHRIEIMVPKKGTKFNILKDREILVREELEQKIIQGINNKDNLLNLKQFFNLSKVPEKIEVYDNSHTGNKDNVGVMICAGKDGFLKTFYRKFNIRFDQEINIDEKGEMKKDDTAMMREVMTRRFKNVNNDTTDKNLPDLLIIDGGIGQLNAVNEVIERLQINIEFIAMAKGEDRNAGDEDFYKIENGEIINYKLPTNSKLLYYLQRLRDEAHRFAITTHIKKRGKNFAKSKIEGISGVGKVRKKKLLNYFGSVSKIKEASVDDIAKTAGVNKEMAEKIKNFL